MIQKCKITGQKFEITQQDIEFYKKMGVPLPTLCPQERHRRRLAFRDKNIYMRKCDKTGKMTMSFYSPEIDWITVYSHEAFWDDSFDAVSYGRNFDFTRPFFEQFKDLFLQVPKDANHSYQDENSQYVMHSSQNKDCYILDESDENRDCFFGYDMQRCKNVVESIHTHDCEIGYLLIWAERCFKVFYSENIFDCRNSAFLKNCRDCEFCLFSTNLVGKKYHIFNKPVSKEQFETYWKNIFCGKRSVIEKCFQQFQDFLADQVQPWSIQVNTENSTGNYLFNVQSVRDSFGVDNSQNCRFCTNIHFSKNCYDTHIYEGELLYECVHAGPKGYNNIGIYGVWFGKNVYYSMDSYNLTDCFGCAGLKNKQYCIMNKQYSKQEYQKLLPQIIEHMKTAGEWGEYFPIEMSIFPYNQSMAQRFYPLTKQEAENWKVQETYIPQGKGKGLGWLEDIDTKLDGTEQKDIPEDIFSLPENIQNDVYISTLSGKKFKFITQEIAFYKKYALPLPPTHPVERIDTLFQKISKVTLFSQKCTNCDAEIESIYTQKDSEKIYCEECYNQQIYG